MKHTCTHPISSTSHSRGRFIPNSEVGNAIEKPCREPGAVGRVTPCAPRLQRAGAKFPRRRLPDPQPIKTLLEFPVPTSKFGFIRVHPFVVKNPHLTAHRFALKPEPFNLQPVLNTEHLKLNTL